MDIHVLRSSDTEFIFLADGDAHQQYQPISKIEYKINFLGFIHLHYMQMLLEISLENLSNRLYRDASNI